MVIYVYQISDKGEVRMGNKYMIATIGDYGNTKELVVYDNDKKEVIRYSKDEIIRNKIKLENIKAEGNNIIGTTGDISRYPKIKRDGTSRYNTNALTIVESTKEKMTVVNYRGDERSLIKSELITMVSQGIYSLTNATLVNNSYIRGINTSFSNKKRKPVYTKRYTGETIKDGKRLSGIIKGTQLIKYNKQDNTLETYKFDERVAVHNLKNKLRHDKDYNCNHIYKYMILGDYPVEVSKTYSNNFIELVLTNKETMNTVISSMQARLGHGIRWNKIDLSVENTKELEMALDYEINGEGTPELGYNELLDQYKSFLLYNKIEDNYIINIRNKGDKIAAIRNCDSSGIYYRVIREDNTQLSKIINVDLEQIYAYHNEYVNVRVEGNKMFIRGFQGEFMYDMDIVHEQYGKKVYKGDKAAAKAKLFDKEVIEDITEDGTLVRYYSNATDTLTLGKDTVNNIAKGAIKIHRKTRNVVINKNLNMCDTDIIYNKDSEATIEHIQVYCGEKVFLRVWKSLINAGVIRDYTETIIEFNRDITPMEYLAIKQRDENFKGDRQYRNIVANNLDDKTGMSAIGEDFVTAVMKVQFRRITNIINQIKDTDNKKDSLSRYADILIKTWRELSRCTSKNYQKNMEMQIKEFITKNMGIYYNKES